MQFRVALGHHLVGDAIETGDFGERKEAAKKKLLTNCDQDQCEGGKEPEWPCPNVTMECE